MNHPRSHRVARHSRRRRLAVGSTLLAGLIAQAFAQQAAPTQKVVITGFRDALSAAAAAKRENLSFTDTIFSEDIGKFPDANLAESLQRISGITISREISGEGLSVSIRGLGTDFTKVLLNGAPVAVASTGATDSQNVNREVDLDLFPSELFSSLSVTKSPTASLLEGGVAGVVDMRTARPFDRPGRRIALTLQGTNNSNGGGVSPNGSIVASTTVDGRFGLLGGLSWARNRINVTGFESIGWTNANLSAAQSSSSTRNNTGGGNWNIPATVPANAGNGLSTGATIDEAFLLANNPGLSITQIDNALIPRLGRPMIETGTKERLSGVVSLQFRPSDTMEFYVDAMAAHRKNDLRREDMNWVGRFGSMVPLNMTVDRSDCSNGCVVTGGTFANAQYFLEYRPFIETVDLVGVNPGMVWEISDRLKLDAQVNYTRSTFHRESPSVLMSTSGSGLTIDYGNDGGIPSIRSALDLNDPANFGWNGGSRVNIQDEHRKTETSGFRSNLTWGNDNFNLRAGIAYDDISRRIRPVDASAAWQAATCGGNPTPFVLGQQHIGCGAAIPAGGGAQQYPGYGTAYTAGATGTVTYNGSLVPNGSANTYLKPAGHGFVTLDWDRLAADTHYEVFHSAAFDVSGANTGAPAGYIRERTTGLYGEVNGSTQLMGNKLRYNAGLRHVRTEQTVGGFISLPDPRNTPTPANGGRYPTIDNLVKLDSRYSDTLPSGTLAYQLGRDFILRGSASQTMTRPNPNSIRPSVNFTNPSADVGSIGNPQLKPYKADNFDLGIEYYGGRESVVALTLFRKSIDGFTVNENITMPFNDLAPLGITMDTLTNDQRNAINARGGPGAATVVMTRQINSPHKLKIEGAELNWMQPLDAFLPVKGFGFTASFMSVHQTTTDPSVVALGVPKEAYNLTAFYENGGVSFRISQAFAKGSQASTLNQNGIAQAAIFNDDRTQVDLSLGVDLGRLFSLPGKPQMTFNVTNLTKEEKRQYFQFPNATFTSYQPGRAISLGFRMNF